MPPIKPFQLQFLLLLTLYCISPSVFSQHRHCGTVEYQRTLRDQLNLRETDQKFEQWLLQNKQTTRTQKNTRQQTPPYKIPVVVHVINNGENIGSGTNISDAQILSQISVLNKDYKRLNADASNTPAEFLSVAGSMDIEFVLAKRDPEGQATNGIVRVQGTKAEWLMSDNYELKSLSYWPAEDYLNIWVCNITDYLGYAQFPVSGLPGLENSSTNRLTDGVVIWYKAFGSSDDGAFPLDPKYNKGRTATHEIGHFFGLRHIWGDDGGECTGTDYCNDTPNQTGSSSGCPAHPRTTCSEVNMFQNFLDYTDDACMNLFTQDQVDRMSIVIENSDRRKSLLTSLGDELPSPVANDIGIKTILSPTETQCSADVTPSIEVKNYGNNTITSVRVRLK
ncbi:MAG: zinc metalloprotease, partial [Bacteroidota bacterium]